MKRVVLFLIALSASTSLTFSQSDSRDGGDVYSSVVYVPFDAFRENRNINEDDATEIGTAIFQYCLKKQEEARPRDWNTVRDNPDLNFDGTRYFITYSYHFNPETGVCSVTIEVYTGPKYNPKSNYSLGTFRGSSQLGYTGLNGDEVNDAGSCYYHAGALAAQAMCESELFARGWETRPFPE